MVDNYRPNKDRDSSYLHYEGAASSIENAGIAYQSPSLIAAGAGVKEIALLNTITNLLYALLLVKVPSVLRFGDSLKKATVILGIVSALGWIPLITVSAVFKSISPIILIILWVISLVPSLMIGPLRDKWLSDIVPGNRLGRYLSFRSIITAGSYVSSFYIMGYFLDHFQDGIFNGFTMIFLMTFSVSLISLILYLIIKMPVAMGEEPQSDIGLLTFIKEAKQNTLGNLILFSAMIIFASSVTGAFFSVYLLKDLHVTYLTYTLVFSVEFISRMGISYFGGKMVDRAGAIKVLRVASFIIPVLPVLWIFSSNIGYLMGAQVLSGMAWATYDICVQSFLCRASPPSKRLHYIIYQRSIVTLAAALGPLLGAVLLNITFPMFGNPIFGIFLISGVMRLAVVFTVLPRLKDTGTDIESSYQENIEILTNTECRQDQIKSQPYRSNTTGRRKLVVLNSVGAKMEIKRGSFYRPECWDLDRSIVPHTSAQNSRQDLLYRPDPRFQSSEIVQMPKPSPESIHFKNSRINAGPVISHYMTHSSTSPNTSLRRLVGARS